MRSPGPVDSGAVDSGAVPRGHLAEVFSAIQGEGPIVGFRQIFVRLGGCNLKCEYCDTPATQGRVRFCLAETGPGKRSFDKILNPVAPERAAQLIARLDPGLHHSVSLTGGEPLLQAAFIAALAPRIKGLGLPVYLETNGTLPGALAQVIDWIDLIGMDWKLPSVTGPGAGGGPDLTERHRGFLEAARGKALFCKMVVGQGTTPAEVSGAAGILATAAPGVELILQPLTPGPGEAIIDPGHLLLLQEAALRILKGVRVIPQTHKFLRQR